MNTVEALFDAGCYVGIATHDAWLIDEGKRIVAERSLAPDEYEFQMLLGVRPELGNALVAEGHRLRIYVPFGSHWYEYSIRRLQENPSVAGYIASDTIGRVLHPGRNGSLMRRRALAILATLLVLAGCGSTVQKNDQPEHRQRPGSNQNPDMDAPLS